MLATSLLAALLTVTPVRQDPGEWTVIVVDSNQSLAVHIAAPRGDGIIPMVALTTLVTPRRQPRPHRQIWEQYEIDCDDGATGRGRIRLLGLHPADPAEPLDPDQASYLPEPVIVDIEEQTAIGRTAALVCRNALPTGRRITGSWRSVLEQLKTEQDSLIFPTRKPD